MGPLATLDFLNQLLAATPAKSDQEHVATVIWNVPQIPDRQRALAGTGESPLPAMLEGIARLNDAGATRIAIPCNTAHLWFGELALASRSPLIHIVDATIDALGTWRERPVGLVATRGTVEAGLYQSRFADRNIECLTNTDAELDDSFTPGCYAVKQNDLIRGGRLLALSGQRLLDRGAARLVLACTEVPIALRHIDSPLLGISIDATQALATACVHYWLNANRKDHAPTVAGSVLPSPM